MKKDTTLYVYVLGISNDGDGVKGIEVNLEPYPRVFYHLKEIPLEQFHKLKRVPML